MNSSAVTTVASRENTLAAAAMSGNAEVLPAARTEAVAAYGRAIWVELRGIDPLRVVRKWRSRCKFGTTQH